MRRRLLGIETFETRIVLSGTPVLIDINPAGPSDPAEFTEFAGRTFFSADDGTNGRELWVTDGTPEGTSMVRDINPGDGGSSPREFVEFQGLLYFAASDGVNGEELWRTDGTSAGTVMVRDIYPGTGYQYPIADGPLQSFPRDPVILNGQLIFSAEDSLGGELWKTDGTTSGTTLISDIAPGTYTYYGNVLPNSSNPQFLTVINNTLFFAADDAVNGRELWKSDGTAAGTVMIKDIFAGTYTTGSYGPYPNSSLPTQLTRVGDTLFFVAQDGDNGAELWKSDGSEAGTVLVKDINVGAQNALSEYTPMADLNGMLLFSANDGISGEELWRSDGTESGTVMVKDVNPGSNGELNQGAEFAIFNNALLFVADDGNTGSELWRSDGTTDGTLQLRDIAVGSTNSYPFFFTEVKGKVYFSAFSPDEGRELWQTDGTTLGTLLVVDAVAGDDGLYPGEIGRVNDIVLFSGDDGVTDRELWALEELDPPIAVDLLSGSDTGDSSTDNVTRLNNSDGDNVLQFLVTGVVDGATVNVYSDDLFIGAAIASGGTATVTSNGILSIPDGTRQITARQFFSGAPTDPSPALTLTIDATPPVDISNVAPEFAQVGLAYSFDAQHPEEGQPSVEYSLIGAPTGMTINAQTGVIDWTPAANQAVPQSYRIAITDAAGNSTSQSVDVTVFGVIPAIDDSYSVEEDDILNITANLGVTSNDGDSGTGTLTATVVDQPTHGLLSFNQDGSFFYQPNAHFFGTDTFTYTATDGADDSNLATVTIEVTPLDDPPVVATDLYTTPEDTLLTASASQGVLANDSDPDGETLTAILVTSTSDGTLTLNSDGSFTYSPNANFTGEDIFTYQVTDGNTTSDPVAVSIIVSSTNDDPVALGDSYTVAEDGLLTVAVATGVLVNDTDDGTALTATVVAQPSHGTLSLNSDGSFTYEPDSNFNGTDTFTYTASDGTSQSNVATVTLVVTDEADPPNAVNDTYSVTMNSTSATLDVLSNDSISPDTNETLTITAVTQGTQGGTVTFTSSSISYTPAAGFSGTETFTYTITDNDSLVDTATVTVAVADVGGGTTEGDGVISGFVYIDADNDGVRDTGEIGVPGALITLTRSGSSEVHQFITTDTGFYRFEDLPEGTYTLVEQQPESLLDGLDSSGSSSATMSEDQVGNLVITDAEELTENNFGELRLKPAYMGIAWFFSTSTTTSSVFREMVAQGEQNAGRQDLAMQIRNMIEVPDNTTPVAVADSYEMLQGETLTVSVGQGVLVNDVDPDGDPLTAVLVSGPSSGTLTSFQPDGSFTFTPAADFAGTVTFTYRVTDQFTSSNTATVSILVNDVDEPTGGLQVAENSPGGTLVGNVFPEGRDNIELFSFELANSLTDPLRLLPDDHLDGNAAAPLVLIEYLDLQCPICQQFHPIVEDMQDTFGDDLLVVRRHLPLDNPHPNARSAARSAEAAGRQGKFEEMVDLMFTNQDDWEAASDPQSFFDSYATQLGLDLTQFTIDRVDPDVDDRIERDEQTIDDLGITVSTPTFYLNGEHLDNNDIVDPNDFEDTLQDVLDDFDSPFVLDRTNGDLFVAGGVGLNFESTPSYTFPVRLTDINGVAETISVTVQVTNVNEAGPVAVADSYSAVTATQLQVSAANGVLANDTDLDQDTLTATLVSGPANGTLNLQADGSFTYTSNAGFTGTDSFQYTASDGAITSGTATVTLTVTGQNLSPVASSDSYTLSTGNVLDISPANGVLANDTDPEGDTLIAQLVVGPTNGTLNFDSDGSFTYDPDTGFTGTDTFTYRATDSINNSQVTTVTIIVSTVNAAPLAVSDSYTVTEDTTLQVTVGSGVLANDSDSNNDPLTAVLVSSTSNGTLVLNANGSFTYTPNADFVGNDSFTYRATDGFLNSATVTVALQVGEVNDSPTAAADVYSIAEDGTLTVAAGSGVLINDTDPDGDTLSATLVTTVAHGTLALQSNGSFVYEPDANFVGTDSFTYSASDGSAASDAATVTITVTAQNDAPAAAADSYSVDEDGTLTVGANTGVLANDVDVDGDNMTVTLGTDVANGTLSLAADGSFVYVPNADFQGLDQFSYTASDGTASSATAIVTVTVVSVNDPAVANDDAYVVAVDGNLVVSGSDSLLANDTDVEGDALSVVLVDNVTNGTLTLVADGTFSYVPNTGFHGSDSFTYRVNDGTDASNTATVTLIVNSVASANDDAYTTDEDTTLTVTVANGVLDNDVDGEGDVLTAVIVTQPANGTVVLNADGSFEYSPATNFNGIDTFTYMANDGFADSLAATVTVTVNAVNDVPDTVQDSYSVPVDGTLSVDAATGVLANDSDAEGDSITATLQDTTQNGTLAFNTDGSFVYTPNSGFHGLDLFTYLASDGTGQSSLTSVALSINSPPTVNDDVATVAEDGTLTINAASGVLANDMDPDSDALSAVLMTDVQNGTLTLNADGSFTYVPAADFFGTDSFEYMANDGFGNSSSAMVTISVQGVNDGPEAADDSFAVDEDVTFSVDAANGLLMNDVDVDGDSLTITLIQDVASGTLTLQTDGSFSYLPNANFVGTDTFTYQVSDGVEVDQAVVTLTVTGVNDAPAGVADTYSIAEDGVLVVGAAEGVLVNDSDPDGDTLTVLLATNVQSGTLSLAADGTFSYEPADDFQGTDTFTYEVSDGTESSFVDVTITVTPVNDAPVAADDSYTVGEDLVLNVSSSGTTLLVNDQDVDGDTLMATVVQSPDDGTVTVNADGSFVYTPNANFSGVDMFLYTVSDGQATSNQATVTITVAGDNDAPVAVADTYTVDEDGTLTIPASTGLLANDSDPDGDTLTVVQGVNPAIGSLQLNADGSFTFTPATNFVGADTFSYRANDGTATSPEATVTISVLPVNDAPTAVANSYTVDENGTLTTTVVNGVLNNDSDVDGDALTAALVQNVSNGTLTLNANGSFTYVPSSGFSGTDTFTYTASDGTLATSPATVTITVNAVNSAPSAVADSYAVVEATQLTVNVANGVLANDSDADGDSLTASVVAQPSDGTLSFQTNGSFTYTPDAGFTGSDSFTYRASDGSLQSAVTTVTLTVTPENEFTIAESAANGAAVGQVVTDTNFGSDVIYEIENATQDALLNLAADDHLSGDPTAPVVLIEYLDFQCPFCAQAHPRIKTLETQFDGELLVVRRHLPLTSLHPNAFVAAIAAEAAGRQGKFEEFGDILFTRQAEWSGLSNPQTRFESYVTELGLSLTQFRTDQADSAISDRIQRDFDAAVDLLEGSLQTPTFFVNGVEFETEPDAFDVQAELDNLNSPFTIDRRTGQISVVDRTLLDFNVQNTYTFNVLASNTSGQHETVAVTVRLTEDSGPQAPLSSSTAATDAVFAELGW